MQICEGATLAMARVSHRHHHLAPVAPPALLAMAVLALLTAGESRLLLPRVMTRSLRYDYYDGAFEFVQLAGDRGQPPSESAARQDAAAPSAPAPSPGCGDEYNPHQPPRGSLPRRDSSPPSSVAAPPGGEGLEAEGNSTDKTLIESHHHQYHSFPPPPDRTTLAEGPLPHPASGDTLSTTPVLPSHSRSVLQRARTTSRSRAEGSSNAPNDVVLRSVALAGTPTEMPLFPPPPSNDPGTGDVCEDRLQSQCDFFFQGFEGFIPSFDPRLLAPDKAISPKIALSFGGAVIEVVGVNSGPAEYLCSKEAEVMEGPNPDQFYASGQNIYARTFQHGAPSYRGLLVQLHLKSVEVDAFGMHLTLSDSDESSSLPITSRCILFKIS